MRTLALATVSGAALLASGSLTPAAHGGSVFRSDGLTPVGRARPVSMPHLIPAASARSMPGQGPAVTASPTPAATAPGAPAPTTPAPTAPASTAPAAVEQNAVGAAELLAKVSSCKRISNGDYRTDEGASSSVPVCGLNGAVFWKADLDIDCDGQVTKACNVDTDPWFQGDTAFHTSDDRPLNAEELPYVVVPSRSSLWDFSGAGIKGGSVVAVVHEGKVVYAVVGDTGPAGIIGEASYATAEALGIDPDPRTGGAASGVTYILFEDSVVEPIESHGAAVTAGEARAQEFLRNN
ncbi:glycoside hydrolase family 75 protein [Streptomyces sp. NPDC005775]|uniref:glycoside hydrolase family 75 protein n=1 Tax=Streptomyces sp. NPDC005775 TaxID=3364729 RepID=UPI00367625BE